MRAKILRLEYACLSYSWPLIFSCAPWYGWICLSGKVNLPSYSWQWKRARLTASCARPLGNVERKGMASPVFPDFTAQLGVT